MKAIKATLIAVLCAVLIGLAIRMMVTVVEYARDICRHADSRLAREVLR